MFAVLLLALSYMALADKECLAFGDSCRYHMLLWITGSCFLGYAFIFVSKAGYFGTSRKTKHKCNSNPKQLKWCGSIHQNEVELSQPNVMWSWYKAGFKKATIFLTFGLALSPVLYKVTNQCFNTIVNTKTIISHE